MCRSDTRENAVVIGSLSTATGVTGPTDAQMEVLEDHGWTIEFCPPALGRCFARSSHTCAHTMSGSVCERCDLDPRSHVHGQPPTRDRGITSVGQFLGVRDLSVGHPARGRGAKLSR